MGVSDKVLWEEGDHCFLLDRKTCARTPGFGVAQEDISENKSRDIFRLGVGHRAKEQ